MKGNIKQYKLEYNQDRNEDGYILAFSLIVVGILLLVSVSLSRVINKETMFSRLVDYNRVAYFAADTGIECAQYIDNVLRDNSVNISLFLNSTSSADGKTEFESNAVNNVFFPTSTISSMSASDYKSKIYCASSGNSNQIFNDNQSTNSSGYVNTADEVISNLSQRKSSYNIVGDSLHATTTFGMVIYDGENQPRCTLVQFAKTREPLYGMTSGFTIISRGYSSCGSENPNKVERTIQIYSTN